MLSSWLLSCSNARPLSFFSLFLSPPGDAFEMLFFFFSPLLLFFWKDARPARWGPPDGWEHRPCKGRCCWKSSIHWDEMHRSFECFLHGEGAMLLKIMNLLNGHASRPSSVSVIVRNYVAKVSMYWEEAHQAFFLGRRCSRKCRFSKQENILTGHKSSSIFSGRDFMEDSEASSKKKYHEINHFPVVFDFVISSGI